MPPVEVASHMSGYASAPHQNCAAVSLGVASTVHQERRCPLQPFGPVSFRRRSSDCNPIRLGRTSCFAGANLFWLSGARGMGRSASKSLCAVSNDEITVKPQPRGLARILDSRHPAQKLQGGQAADLGFGLTHGRERGVEDGVRAL